MGASKCSCCERSITTPCNVGGPPPNWPKLPGAPEAVPGVLELAALSYHPPPTASELKGLDAFLGTQLPTKPLSQAPTPPVAAPQTQGTASRSSPSCARPGEPVNKVYVQFSNDLEGFLPYTLVISKAMGLEFTSLSSSPDFSLDPLNILKADRVSYDVLTKDAFFVSLAKSILSKSEATQPQSQQRSASNKSTARSLERVRPPYSAIVQLNVRRTVLEGGQVLVFIAVQSELLAEELLRSCHRLKKRRAVKHPYATEEYYSPPRSPRSPHRGHELPRAVPSPA